MGEGLRAAKEFVFANGRVLDQRRFGALFEGHGPWGVTAALGAYRNPDGGFGHGLEPDKRCPDSQALDVQVALEVMHEIPGSGEAGWLAEACEFLASIADPSGAVPILLPSIAGYPRAAHWEATTYEPGLNPTAVLAGLLHALGADHPWLDDATGYCFEQVEKGAGMDEAHSLSAVLVFLEHAPDRTRAERCIATAAAALPHAAYFKADPEDSSYGLSPLQFAPRPSSRWRPLFADEMLEAHLARLEADQAADGGWPLAWDPPSEASRLEWRAMVTIAAVATLAAYGRSPDVAR